MDIEVGSLVKMKKGHPCGNDIFKVTRVGMDFKLVCIECGHEIMLPRKKAEKNIRKIIQSKEDETI